MSKSLPIALFLMAGVLIIRLGCLYFFKGDTAHIPLVGAGSMIFITLGVIILIKSKRK